MATLVLTVVGTAVGGPIGGALGAIVGQQLDQNLLFKPKGREGPRLAELAVQTSSYGTQIPRIFGKMRVAGSVIWATDIKETKGTDGGGKGRPKTTNYSYSACFAVALSSRNIQGIGRIWADGKILRGSAGDFKTPTGFRLHLGHEDQIVDSLTGAAEAEGGTPAYRDCAYAVFEDMELADYGNRIPSLTIEVIADDGGISLTDIVDDVSGGKIALSSEKTLHGYSASGADRRSALSPVMDNYYISPTAAAEKITAISRLEAYDEPVIAIDDRLVAGIGGEAVDPPEIQTFPETKVPQQLSLRYYEPARDYQSGLQNAFRPGHGRAIANRNLPAAIGSDEARAIAEAGLRIEFGERVSGKAHIALGSDPLTPGSLIYLPGDNRVWRVRGWELKNGAAEVSLTRASRNYSQPSSNAEEGRSISDADLSAGATRLVMVDLPFAIDAPNQAATTGQLYAVAAGDRGWRNADLFSANGDGSVGEIIGQISVPAIIGTANQALGSASPFVRDTKNEIEITLQHQDMQLQDADDAQILAGNNIALLDGEFLQFGRAVPLGNNRYRLSHLIRGLGGTEDHISGHQAGEDFVLIEPAAMTAVDPQFYSLFQPSKFYALGRDDEELVSAIAPSPGMALLPWSPVHPRAEMGANGDLAISWARRSRGGSLWLDGVGLPLSEESERYAVHIADGENTVLSELETSGPSHRLPSTAIDQYRSNGANSLNVSISQIGQYGRSEPATLHVAI